MAALALGGCAQLPWPLERGPASAAPAEFLVKALATDVGGREALWQAALHEPDGEPARLHRALLRSIPGSSGYDPAAAEVALQDLVAQKPSVDVERVARARLEDLHTLGVCHSEVDNLKRRLSKVADIERRLDRERR